MNPLVAVLFNELKKLSPEIKQSARNWLDNEVSKIVAKTKNKTDDKIYKYLKEFFQ